MKKIIYLLLVLFIGFPSTSQAQNVKQIVKTGDEFFSRGNYNDALIQYSKAIDVQSNNASLYVKRAGVYEKTGDFEKAAEDYDRAGVFDSKNSDIFYQAGRMYYKMGDYNLSLEKAQSALQAKRNNLDALALKIDALIKLNKYSNAIEDAKTLLRYKETADNYYKFAIANEKNGLWSEAVKAYQDAIRKDRRHFEAYTSLADLQRRMKNNTQALQNINNAIQYDPKYPKAYVVRSRIYNEQMKHAEAINDISTVILLQPENEEMYLIRGKYYQDFAQHMFAINDFSKVISLNPKHADALFNRAYSYEQTMNFREAIRDYDALKKLGGDDEKVILMLADAEKRLFELNRETDKPVIKLTDPEEKPQRMLMIPRSKDNFILKGKIFDQSPVKSLVINGASVPVNKKDDAYEFLASVNLTSDQIVIEASDVYDNVEIAYYKVNRTETDPPVIRIIAPYASDNNVIYLDSNEPNIFVEGSVFDESHITSIYIDGVIASYIPQDLNPTFQAYINVMNKDRFTVKAEDKFGNVSESIFSLNREGAAIASDNPMGKTWVVFIENSNYQNFASLEGPVKDVTLMKSALARYTIHNFIHKKDMTKQELEKFFAIELRDMIRSNRVNSIMVWYAGHGKFVNETGYWVPVDAKRDDEFTYFSINALRASMQSYPNTINHTLVITDACESGPSFYQAMRSGLQIRNCNDPVASRLKSAQVFSSAGYELAVDNSQFTRTFSNVLVNSQDACVPIESIVQKVTSAVVSNNQQKPQFGKIAGLEDEDGTFFFVTK